MAEPRSDAENIALVTAAQNQNGDGGHWIGLTDKYIEGQWVYRSDKDMQIIYDNWHPIEPSNSGGAEQYAIFNIHSDPYLWTDWPISNTGKIICEKPVCPKGWTLVRGRCYYLSSDLLTYDQSLAFCASQGGKLFEPKNAEDNLAISQLVGEIFWIGLNDKASEGTWVYASDGSIPTYDNFAPNEPNDHGGVQDCGLSNFNIAGLGLSLWDDQRCNVAVYKYACQLGGE